MKSGFYFTDIFLKKEKSEVDRQEIFLVEIKLLKQDFLLRRRENLNQFYT